MKIHVFGSCEKKLNYIGKVSVPSCVCGRGGERGMCDVFSLGSSIFICFFRQKATIVFHSLKARVHVFLFGDDGEGTETFLVNNVERSLLIGCFNVCFSFHLPFHQLFRCVLFLVNFLCSQALFWQMYTYSRI